MHTGSESQHDRQIAAWLSGNPCATADDALRDAQRDTEDGSDRFVPRRTAKAEIARRVPHQKRHVFSSPQVSRASFRVAALTAFETTKT